MALDTDVQEYTSPLRKLTRFFRKSRDKWKRKCLDAKQNLKLVKNRVRAVERSRDRWSERACERQRRIDELEAELQKTADDFA